MASPHRLQLTRQMLAPACCYCHEAKSPWPDRDDHSRWPAHKSPKEAGQQQQYARCLCIASTLQETPDKPRYRPNDTCYTNAAYAMLATTRHPLSADHQMPQRWPRTPAKRTPLTPAREPPTETDALALALRSKPAKAPPAAEVLHEPCASRTIAATGKDKPHGHRKKEHTHKHASPPTPMWMSLPSGGGMFESNRFEKHFIDRRRHGTSHCGANALVRFCTPLARGYEHTSA